MSHRLTIVSEPTATPGPGRPLGLNAYGASDVGRQRSHNEDCFLCDPDYGMFAVIDGVGGYAAGEVAARLAYDHIKGPLAQPAGTAAERLRLALTEANNAIYHHSRANAGQRGMACVMTAALVEHGRVTIGHVGDTRLYEVRRDGIRKITRDHSPVGLREDVGDLSEYEAMNHPRRSEILRDLGSDRHEPNDAHFIDIYQIEWAEDSALLLCSDGLTDLVSKAAIHQVLLDHAGDPEKGAQTLIELANEMGGTDNITVLIVEGPAFRQPLPKEPAERFASPVSLEAAEAVPMPQPTSHRWQSRTAFFAYGWGVGLLLSLLPLLLIYQMLDRRISEGSAAQAGPPGPQTLPVALDSRFQTISAALDAARPGDIITVAPGVYREVVALKEGVAVVSAIPGEAVIQSQDSVVVVAHGIRNARLAGFKVESQAAEGSRATGIYLRDASIEVVDVEVSGAGGAGVLIVGTSEAVLRANRIIDNPGGGVHVRGVEARPRFVQNVIRRNGAAREAHGVLLEDGARPVLRQNIITENAAAGIRLVGSDGSLATQWRQHNYFLVDGIGNARRAIEEDE